MTPEEKLQISVKISNAVTSIIGKLSVKPKFIIAKGGITSSDVGTKALRVKKAPCYGTGEERDPGMDDRRRKQIPWNAIHYFPGKCG